MKSARTHCQWLLGLIPLNIMTNYRIFLQLQRITSKKMRSKSIIRHYVNVASVR
jgi:hypothetical protein